MSAIRTFLPAWIVLASAGAWAGAAEIELRAECACSGAVVTLADVADVAAADADEAARLGRIELGPAPPPGRTRIFRHREIQDLLLLQGENLGLHRFAGAGQTLVKRSAGQSQQIGLAPKVSEAVQRRANRQLSDAIVAHLTQAVAAEPWSVALELSGEQARLVAGVGNAVAIQGGRSPWTGSQRFEVTVTPPDGAAARFVVDAHVALPEAVVTAVRALPRGAMLGAADLQLQRTDAPLAVEGTFHAIEEVVGKEAVRAIAAGQPITEDAVRSPLLVRRGEIVSVTAQSTSIRLTTNARAREDGSLGDVIRVEALQDRTAYMARVCGLRSLEVYAGPVRARRAEGALSDSRGGIQ
ncbi:MAG: flagellar basal body P-ring formation protein FlgA [Pirellulales bacterium]|nr:flagellar basal body P-ring formation protein FlgA [Pirellulales bacterium]